MEGGGEFSCAQICSPVTERNAYVYMRNPEVAPYTCHEYYLCDRIFVYKENISVSLKFNFLGGSKALYIVKPSSVTRRNIMDGMGNGLGIVYTPHQCWYSDRKSPYGEKSPKVPLGASGTSITIPNTLP